MRKSEPFNRQLHLIVGDDPRAEPILWFSSVILGIFACKIVYNLMKAYSPVYFNGYNKLSKRQKVEWDNRGFSTGHAIVVSATAAYLLLFSNLFKDDDPVDPIVFRNSLLSEVILGVSMGYFISDLAMILVFYPDLGGKEYVLHHLMSIIALSLSMCTGQGHFYSYIILFSELTTPFVNLRWYLSAAGMKNSKAYVINGLFLFFSWLIARNLLFIYVFIHIYLHYYQVKQMCTSGFYSVIITVPCLALMNLFWFYKIARGLLRTLSKRA